MRPIRPLAWVALGALALASPAAAKFGMSKTKVTLRRTRPPEVPLLGETVSVDVTSRARSVSDRHLDVVRRRVQDAVSADKSMRLVEAKAADNVVRVEVDGLEARVDDNTIYEEHYVKIGERQEWDDKKKKMVTKDVYGNRQEPVRLRKVRGRVDARVQVETPAGQRTADAGTTYEREFKGNVNVPEEASSESRLEAALIDEAARRAAAAVSFSPDPVEAMLAVDGELKDGNRLAEAGLWKEAMASWSARTFKGDKEAARLHNVGVAHEAFAYGMAIDSPEHHAELEQAADSYKKALALDPGEKYFAEPIQRVQASLEYAGAAQRYADEVRRWHEERSKRSASASRSKRTEAAAAPAAPAPPATPAEAPAAARRRAAATPAPAAPKAAPPAAAKTAAPADPLSASAGVSLQLRNGSFESGLDPWTVTGKGAVVPDARHGRVFQAAGGAATTLAQPVGLDVQNRPGATLSLDYKVSAGEGKVRVMVAYDDAAGRARTSTLEVTAGDPAGDWTPWTGDLLALRPKPARLKEVRIVSEGGTVLLDNVALTLR
jgi:hypothetical protein